mmetsp:Transcript_10152/g.24368  ORF Transcript_10152/g.24368 Transcript_10152/m.24368 type:complete len:242 (+) Transcript_10152:771-1496(+)
MAWQWLVWCGTCQKKSSTASCAFTGSQASITSSSTSTSRMIRASAMPSHWRTMQTARIWPVQALLCTEWTVIGGRRRKRRAGFSRDGRRMTSTRASAKSRRQTGKPESSSLPTEPFWRPMRWASTGLLSWTSTSASTCRGCRSAAPDASSDRRSALWKQSDFGILRRYLRTWSAETGSGSAHSSSSTSTTAMASKLLVSTTVCYGSGKDGSSSLRRRPETQDGGIRSSERSTSGDRRRRSD